MKLTVILPALLLTLAAGSCSRGDDATPRRRAFPRVELYDTVYSAPDSLPLHIEINAGVPSESPHQGWLDVAYPRYGAVLHLSAVEVEPERLAAEIENRRERMSLNLYGLSADTEHLTSADSAFEAVLLTCPDATATPLQFVATDGYGTVVSGSAYMAGVTAASSADSIAPMVGALRRDIIHLLKHLSHAQP